MKVLCGALCSYNSCPACVLRKRLPQTHRPRRKTADCSSYTWLRGQLPRSTLASLDGLALQHRGDRDVKPATVSLLACLLVSLFVYLFLIYVVTHDSHVLPGQSSPPCCYPFAPCSSPPGTVCSAIYGARSRIIAIASPACLDPHCTASPASDYRVGQMASTRLALEQ